MSLSSTAQDDHNTTDVDLQVNSDEVVVASKGLWASLFGASDMIKNTYLSPSQLSDFWEKAKEHQETLQSYVLRLLTSAGGYFKSTAFTDIPYAMNEIVRATAAFRNGIQGALDAHHITLDMLTKELEVIFMGIVRKLERLPPPENAHAEREEMVNTVLDDTEQALIGLATRYEIEEATVTTYLHALRPPVHRLTVAVGNINARWPFFFMFLTFSITIMLIPQAWILRPFLSVLGFGPAGPVAGSIAAGMQSFFWGAAVRSGSWFALLQAAGMGVIPVWAGVVTKVPLVIGGLFGALRSLFPGSTRSD